MLSAISYQLSAVSSGLFDSIQAKVMKKSYLSTFLLIIRFTLWAYGFSYASFWYTTEGPSLFEPLRLWLIKKEIALSLHPGFLEQFAGLVAAASGAILKVKYSR
jgi:hypothetical protein